MSLNEPKKKIAVQNELFRIGVENMYMQTKEYNSFNIVHNDESTVEKTLKLLEEHFKL